MFYFVGDSINCCSETQKKRKEKKKRKHLNQKETKRKAR
jgi:hypothetical protein